MACTRERSNAIGDLAAGRLSAAGAEDLLEHLDSCPECSAEFSLVADLVGASERQGGSVSSRPRAIKLLRPVLSAAAAVLIAVTIWWAVSDRGESGVTLRSLAEKSSLPSTGSVLRTAGQTQRDHVLKNAMELYSREDFAGAEKELSRVIELEPDNALAHLYLGISRLQAEMTSQAVPPLIRASELGEDLVQERALWFLGNAYLMLDQGHRALETFKTLEAKEGDYELNARDLAARIREILEQ